MVNLGIRRNVSSNRDDYNLNTIFRGWLLRRIDEKNLWQNDRNMEEIFLTHPIMHQILSSFSCKTHHKFPSFLQELLISTLLLTYLVVLPSNPYPNMTLLSTNPSYHLPI